MGRHVSGEGDERVWSPVHVGSVCSAQVSCEPKATEKMRPIFYKINQRLSDNLTVHVQNLFTINYKILTGGIDEYERGKSMP